MSASPVDLATLRSFSAAWTSSSAEEDLRRWTAFLAEHGLPWSPDAKDRQLIEQLTGSAPTRAGEAIEARLSKLANDALTKRGDARRVCKQVSAEPTRRWVVLSPEQRATLLASGQRFDSGMEGTIRQLATIPLTLGAYFGAAYLCRANDVDPNVAWVVALAVYVITVRVVRGRWPLQPR